MKRIPLLLIVVSLPLFFHAQSNCADLVIFPPSGKGGTSLKSMDLEGIQISMANVDHTYVLLSLSTGDKAVCFDSGKPIVFGFADGTETSLPNEIDAPCSQAAMINMGAYHKKEAELSSLQNKQVSFVRYASNAGERQISLSPEQQLRFQETLNCITNKLR